MSSQLLNPLKPPQQSSLKQLIQSRHSTRTFLSTPIPRSLIEDALSLAQLAPSSSNIQPWRIWVLEGNSRDRLAKALQEAFTKSEPNIPPVPESFKHLQNELGELVYGIGMSIPRSDTAARIAAVARNFQFFDAPVELMICMDRSLNHVDSLSIGMYLEALVLRLTEMGVGSCLQVSISGYAEVVKRELGIGEEMEVICGMAVGIEDVRDPVNMIRTSRADVKDCVTFVEE